MPQVPCERPVRTQWRHPSTARPSDGQDTTGRARGTGRRHHATVGARTRDGRSGGLRAHRRALPRARTSCCRPSRSWPTRRASRPPIRARLADVDPDAAASAQPVPRPLVQRPRTARAGRGARARRPAAGADRRGGADRRRPRRPLPDDPRAQGARRLRLPGAAPRHRAVRPDPPARGLAVDRQLLPRRRGHLAHHGLPRRRRPARGHEPRSASTGSSAGSPTRPTSSARRARRATSRRSTTRCAELDREPGNVIFNQFSRVREPPRALRRAPAARSSACSRRCARPTPGLRLRGLRLGDRLGRHASPPATTSRSATAPRIVAVEALECPTLLDNGFGEHNIQGIGDKHVPLIHNVMNTDVVVGVSDRATDALRRAVQHATAGREYLRRAPRRARRESSTALASLRPLVASATSWPRSRPRSSCGLGPDDVDRHGRDRRRRDVRAPRSSEIVARDFAGGFDAVAAAETFGRAPRWAPTTDHLLELHARPTATASSTSATSPGSSSRASRSTSSRPAAHQAFWTRPARHRAGVWDEHDRRVQRRGRRGGRRVTTSRPGVIAARARRVCDRLRRGCGSRGDAAARSRCPRARPGDDIDHVMAPRARPGRVGAARPDARPEPVRPLPHAASTPTTWRARAGWTDARYVDLVARARRRRRRGRRPRLPRSRRSSARPRSPSALGLGRAGGVWVKDETGNVSGSHKARHLMGVMLELARGRGASAGRATPTRAARHRQLRQRRAGRGRRGARRRSPAARLRAARRRAAGRRPAGRPRRQRRASARGRRGRPAIPSTARSRRRSRPAPCPSPARATRTASPSRAARRSAGSSSTSSRDRGATARPAGRPGRRRGARLGPRPGRRRRRGRRLDRSSAAARHGPDDRRRAARARLRAGRGPPRRRRPATPIDLARHADALAEIAHQRSRFMWPWETEPRSVADGILDDETYDWLAVVRAMLASGGRPIVVDEATLVEAERARPRRPPASTPTPPARPGWPASCSSRATATSRPTSRWP